MADEITNEWVVRDLLVEYPGLLQVLEKQGVDYCCGGAHTLEEAATERHLDLKRILKALNEAPKELYDRADPDTDWTLVPLPQLVDHILEKHHSYLKGQLPHLQALVFRVFNVHQAKHGLVLRRLRDTFGPFKAELDLHLQKEETGLFSRLLALDKVPDFAREAQACAELIHALEAEHAHMGHALSTMWEATGGFNLPQGGDATFSALYEGLKEMTMDLRRHIHLENNILFLKVLAKTAR